MQLGVSLHRSVSVRLTRRVPPPARACRQDHTIYALVEGRVKFTKVAHRLGRKGYRSFVEVEPYLPRDVNAAAAATQQLSR